MFAFCCGVFLLFFFFFFNDTATTEIYTLSLHDALPIWSLAGEDLRGGTADLSVLIGIPHRPGGDLELRFVCLLHRACGDRHAGELSSDDDHFRLCQAVPQTGSAELGQRRLVFGGITCATHLSSEWAAVEPRDALAAAMCQGRRPSGLGAARACGMRVFHAARHRAAYSRMA